MPKAKKLGVAKPKKIKATAFDVFDTKGNFVRQYNKELHGDRAEEYAKKFTEGTNMTFKAI